MGGAPATRRDRTRGAIIGGIGGFWVGLLGRMILGPLPVSIQMLAWWALGAAITGLVLGVRFPEVTTCVFLPFASFGISD